MVISFRPYKIEWDSTGDGTADTSLTPKAITSNFVYNPFMFSFNSEEYLNSNFDNSLYIYKSENKLINLDIDIIVSKSQLDTLMTLLYNTHANFDNLDTNPQYVIWLKDSDDNSFEFYVAQSVSDGFVKEPKFIIVGLEIKHRVANRADDMIHVTINLIEITNNDIDGSLISTT